MKLSQLVTEINNLSDEQESVQKVTGFINDAIAKINIKLKTKFPYMDYSQDVEPAFPETWQRALLIPFAVGRVKQMDSSQFEFSQAYSEFAVMLDDMNTQYIVPEEYIDYETRGYTFNEETQEWEQSPSNSIFSSPPWSHMGGW
jgi:hypothetical protein